MHRKVQAKLEDYFAKIPDEVKKNPSVVTYNQGFYYSTSKALSGLEDQFIEYTKQHLNDLTTTLKNSKSLSEKTTAIHLLGWYQNPQEIYQVLKEYILDPVQEIRNAAARATFPQIASGIVEPDPHIYFALLRMPSDYDKNKALGTILRSQLINQVSKRDTEYIKKLSKHPLPMIHIPAKKILEQLSK